MTETEFILHTDSLFNDLMTQIDELDTDTDFDCLISGNLLTIECEESGKIVINRHNANQELWLASKEGGYHFSFLAEKWLTKDGKEFFTLLNEVLSDYANEKICLSA